MSVSNISEPQDDYYNDEPINWRELWRTISVLFKLRIVFLLLLSAVGGSFIGAKGWPGFNNFLIIIFSGGFAAAGASALNQYWEREKDKQMERTKERPLVNGTISDPTWVPALALGMIFVSVFSVLRTNFWLGFYLGLGAFIYVVIYTIWLKPRTLLNIVIGGAAGSAAVMAGGAAVGAAHTPAVIGLACVMFLWTPAHFWSLAIVYKDDYGRSDTPMLPNKTNPRHAAWWVMSHTVPLVFSATVLGVLPQLGWLYTIPVAIFSAGMIWGNIKLIMVPEKKEALRLFLASNFYLMVILIAIMLTTTIPGAW